MTNVERTEDREFRDNNGVKWRVLPHGAVKVWNVGIQAWLDSKWTVAELEAEPDIREVSPVGGDV
jgi:hypothetical protein